MANRGKSLPAEVFNNDELVKFFSTFTSSLTGRRNHCIFLLALRGQLRCNEIVNLRVSDINTKQGSITVLKGKGGKRRVVGIDRETCGEIDSWTTTRPHNNQGLLFASHKGHRLSTSYIRKLASRHGIKGGVEKRVHVHGFRHTGACFLAYKGVDLRVIQKQLGHSSLAVTSRYLDHLGANEVVETVSAVQW